MSYINTDGYGYSERELEQNWAAEYAKIVTNELEEKLDAEITELDSDITALEAKHDGDISALNADIAAMGLRHDADVEGIEAEISAFEAKHNRDLTELEADIAADMSAAAVTVDVYEGNMTFPDPGDLTCSLRDDEVSAFMGLPLADKAARQRADALMTYGADEEMIGRWQDGTPIWRKTFMIDSEDLDGRDHITRADIGIEKDPDCVVLGLGGICSAKSNNASFDSLGDEVPVYRRRNFDPDKVFDISALDSVVKEDIDSDGGIFFGYVIYAAIAPDG